MNEEQKTLWEETQNIETRLTAAWGTLMEVLLTGGVLTPDLSAQLSNWCQRRVALFALDTRAMGALTLLVSMAMENRIQTTSDLRRTLIGILLPYVSNGSREFQATLAGELLEILLGVRYVVRWTNTKGRARFEIEPL